MTHHAYVERLVNLLDPDANQILNMSTEDAVNELASGSVERVRAIDGQFALLHKDGQLVRMARSIGRPMRYFLAKRTEGPCLVVAERMDEIFQFLQLEGLDDQFHPSYTRMVPAHYVLELKLIGCPDPSPTHRRFFAPVRNRWVADSDAIGEKYVGQLAVELDRWLDRHGADEPIGVLFSGGIDSGAVFLTLLDRLLRGGQSPARLKAFTLGVEGRGDDRTQAREFLKKLDLELFLEVIDVPRSAIDYRVAIKTIEEYKPLDVQAAAMGHALCEGIRNRYPDWRLLVDGDGGDENMKDYPIEENSELTITSVLNNTMLYQEGWGVDAVKHSQTYSGGQSRGHIRSSATARKFGFTGFSPFALPNLIEIAEGIPFIEMTQWDHDRLYQLKGEIVRSGVRQITGYEMPAFPKRRFQKGAADDELFGELFPAQSSVYRQAFQSIYA